MKTFKNERGTSSIIRNVSDGVHPIFQKEYVRQLYIDPQAKIVFLQNEEYDFTMYVSKEEAERISAPITSCPICEAEIPFTKE